MSLESIFNELLLDHSRFPRHYGKIGDSNISVEGNNIMCGDQIVLSARVVDGKVDEIAFTGKACAICTASASMFCDNAEGHSLSEVEHARQIFQKYLRGEAVSDADKQFLGDAASLEGVSKLPARVKCATLVYEAWNIMRQRILAEESAPKIATTE